MKRVLLYLFFFSCICCLDDNGLDMSDEDLLDTSIESVVDPPSSSGCRMFIYKTKGFDYSGQREFSQRERNTFYYEVLFVFNYPSIQDYLLTQFEDKGMPIYVAISENMSASHESYYDPQSKTIFFKKEKYINFYNIEHEFLHAVQHQLLEYPMASSYGRRSIEYEAFVAMDLLKCISKGRKLQEDEIWGNPGGTETEKYLTMLHKLTNRDSVLFLEPSLDTKFNKWIKTWSEYTDDTEMSQYVPRLLHYILDINRRKNGDDVKNLEI